MKHPARFFSAIRLFFGSLVEGEGLHHCHRKDGLIEKLDVADGGPTEMKRQFHLGGNCTRL